MLQYLLHTSKKQCSRVERALAEDECTGGIAPGRLFKSSELQFHNL